MRCVVKFGYEQATVYCIPLYSIFSSRKSLSFSCPKLDVLFSSIG